MPIGPKEVVVKLLKVGVGQRESGRQPSGHFLALKHDDLITALSQSHAHGETKSACPEYGITTSGPAQEARPEASGRASLSRVAARIRVGFGLADFMFR